MYSKPLVFLSVLFVVVSASARGSSLNFDFTFIGQSSQGGMGTVSGELLGLTDNATSAPTGIIITSDPFGDSPTHPLVYSTPLTEGGTFTVDNGVITATTDFSAENQTDLALLDLGNDNELIFPDPGYFVGNDDGFSGAIYTVVATPEPQVMAYLVLGTLVFFVQRRLAGGNKSSRHPSA